MQRHWAAEFYSHPPEARGCQICGLHFAKDSPEDQTRHRKFHTQVVDTFAPRQRAPATAEMPDGTPATDVAWLEPYPDSELEGIADDAPNPEARYTAHEAVQLAFIATIQHLPPRQRAVLLLCDVLGWAATEAATLLGGSTASVTSALQRARETLGKRNTEDQPLKASA